MPVDAQNRNISSSAPEELTYYQVTMMILHIHDNDST